MPRSGDQTPPDQPAVPAARVGSVADLRRAARAVSEELAVAEWVARGGYRVGYIRFAPAEHGRAEAEQKAIVHQDLDVCCLVLAGRGRLRHEERVTALTAGDVCHIPAGTPHDFSATTEPLELLYATISVAAIEGPSAD